ALAALAKRPPEQYQKTLLGGFSYPWPAVADHAAEALVALERKELVPALLPLLEQPNPALAYEKPRGVHHVKEMVRVNHVRNCLMCHAPSLKQDDKVRGFVPPTTQPLPPAFSREYYAPQRQGVFVRADVTYLRQDFSVPLPVKNPGLWPQVQRYDFLVRERPALPGEIALAKSAPAGPTEHQKALFFALRELTGADPGPTVQDWKRHFLNRKLEARHLHTGFKAARAVAVDRDGKVYVADQGVIWRQEGDAKPSPWLKGLRGVTNGLAFDGKG